MGFPGLLLHRNLNSYLRLQKRGGGVIPRPQPDPCGEIDTIFSLSRSFYEIKFTLFSRKK